MKSNNGTWYQSILGSGLTTLSAVVGQTWDVNTIAGYVSLGFTVLVGIVTIAYTLYCWIRKSKENKNVTTEDVSELMDKLDEIQKKLPKVK